MLPIRLNRNPDEYNHYEHPAINIRFSIRKERFIAASWRLTDLYIWEVIGHDAASLYISCIP